ncbi:GGDEF domain-containing protein [Litorilituus sediminis]|uniref:diguanylate cyclase n=1 Tax=Litorilituus sediminis TaxID=718192 RepID=A0A4P6P1B2_9GAMM|nr:GGDEF domain-containing protein [Litorilituus sediminis]QBG34258.1 GGDEF domain-containing protein [Litorilituus sediminis]
MKAPFIKPLITHLSSSLLHLLFIGLYLWVIFIGIMPVQAATQSQITLDSININDYQSHSGTSNNAIDGMLIEADKLRSSNNNLSKLLLEKISKQAFLTNKQQAYLKYLSALQLGYEGKYQDIENMLLDIQNLAISGQLKYRSHYTLVDLYVAQQDWAKGHQQVQNLLAQETTYIDKQYTLAALLSITDFYNQLEQYSLALDYSQRVLKSATTVRNRCFAERLVTQAKLRSKFPLLSIDNFNQGMRTCQQAKEPILFGFINIDLAEFYLENKQAAQVTATLLPLLDNFKATEYQPLITLAYNALAQAYWQTNDSSNSLKFAKLAEQNIIDSTPEKIKLSIYELLYKLAEQQQNYPLALHYHKQYDVLLEQHLSSIQNKHLAYQLANFEDLAHKEEISSLSQKNQLLSTEQAIAKQKEQTSLLLIMLLLSCLGLISIWSYKSWLTQRKLKQLTDYDELTQVASRNHFIELSNSALSYCYGNEQPVSCVLFDVDEFKSINDNYGHATGDKALIAITQACQAFVRDADVFGRLGGEEFALILPGFNQMLGEDIAEQCRRKINNIDFNALGLNQPLSASFGVSETDSSGFNLTTLLADADSAMYSSKQHGKNCVTLYQ